jgi:hypothetical protein
MLLLLIGLLSMDGNISKEIAAEQRYYAISKYRTNPAAYAA